MELGAKVKDNQKSSQNNRERIQGNSHKLVSVKAHLELHEDKQENTLITQGKLVERLEEQAQQQAGTIQKLRNKIEILSQPVYHQLPAQYLYPVPTDQE